MLVKILENDENAEECHGDNCEKARNAPVD